MFMTSVSTNAVRDSSCTVSTIGPRPRIWCSTGTGLRSHGEAVPTPPSSTSTSRLEAIPPVAQRLFTRDAQARARDRIGSAPLGGGREIEEGEIGAGIGFAVGIEQVIGADVVLVDGLIDQPHAKQAGVEGQIVPGFRRDRGQMMNSA